MGAWVNVKFLRFSMWLLLFGLVAALNACSERGPVDVPMDPGPEIGRLELTLSLRASNLDDAGLGDPATHLGESLAVFVRVLDDGSGAELSTATREISASSTTETFEFDLPAGLDTRYRAEARVDGIRTRPTGTTEHGLLHFDTSPPFQILVDQSRDLELLLDDLVPQLWIFETVGVRHELRWSPVAGATRYKVRRSADGELAV